jgi:hypothetical protein
VVNLLEHVPEVTGGGITTMVTAAAGTTTAIFTVLKILSPLMIS